jgi:hypothetical protein
MTKFGKVEKIECSGFLFWIVRFWQFQTQTEEGAKIENLNIQGEFKHGKGRQGTEGPRQEIQAKRTKSQKPDGPVLDSEGSGFLRTDRV